MTAATFELDPATTELRAWLETAIRDPGDAVLLVVTDSIAPPDAPEAYCVLFAVPGVRTAPAPLRGATMLTARWVITSVGATPSQARTVADRVRVAWAGTDRHGAYTTALTLTGLTAIRRASQDDGALDIVSGISQWSETLELDLVPA